MNDRINALQSAVSENASADKDSRELVSTCIQCHGGELTGARGPDLTNLSLSKEEIVDILKNGKGTMPPRTAEGYEEEVAEYLLNL